jgi:hypothetical protein
MDVCIVLGKLAQDSRVFLAGVDVSSACQGVDVRAHVGEVTRITLHLIGRVEMTGEIGELIIKPAEASPREGETE